MPPPSTQTHINYPYVPNHENHPIPSPWLLLSTLFLPLNSLSAGQFGDFTFTDDGTSITITDYPSGGFGPAEIPSSIEGKPVTTIGDEAFSRRYFMTSVTIPSGVTSIGDFAFFDCGGLSAISVDGANPSYRSAGGVLFDRAQELLLQYPGNKDGDYTIPPSVTSIGKGAFWDCDGLTSVTIPASVTSLGDEAFSHCDGLNAIYFLGNAPDVGRSPFSESSSLTFYCSDEATGFTSPKWQGRPLVRKGASSPLKK